MPPKWNNRVAGGGKNGSTRKNEKVKVYKDERKDDGSNERQIVFSKKKYLDTTRKDQLLGANETVLNGASPECPGSVDDDGTSVVSPLDVHLSLNISYISPLPGNECRLHGSVFRKLKIEPGGILSLFASSSTQPIVLEAFVSSTASSLSIEVSNDLSYVLEGVSSVLVKPLGLSFLPQLQLVVLSLTLLGANSQKSDTITTEEKSLQWKALFRQRFFNSLIYRGMRTTIQNALGTIIAEIVEAKGCGEKLQSLSGDASSFCFGTLGSSTTVLVSSEYMNPLPIKERPDKMYDSSDSQDLTHSSPEPSSKLSPGSTKFAHLLVLGQEGTGKTFTLKEEKHRHEAGGRFVFFVEVASIANSEGSQISSPVDLHEWFLRARASAPSTIIVDDLHLICHDSSSILGSSWATGLLARSFVEELRSLEVLRADVCVLASAPSAESLHSILLSSSAFGNYIKRLETPSSVEEKVQCLRQCLVEVAGPEISSSTSSSLVPNESASDPKFCHLSVSECEEVVERTNGFTQRDFRRLVEHAVTEFFKRKCHLKCTVEALIESARIIQPSTLREFDVSIPDVTWDDIGGSEYAKKVLREVVRFALGEQKAVFHKYHLSPPRGVLLYGPPGCSKTMLAKALANESHLNFISVKGPEVFSKWVGDSEKAVRNIFSRARAAAPCVVFIDELDGMCGHRGQGGVSDRVISQFLTELDGLPSALSEKDHALIFVAATNRPDNIDGAVLRPGRIDKLVHVGLPDEVERQKIIEIQFKHMPISPELSASYVACITEGYSGAEVVALIKEAALHAVSVSIDAEHITKHDVVAASTRVRPRTKHEDVQWYLNWRRQEYSRSLYADM